MQFGLRSLFKVYKALNVSSLNHSDNAILNLLLHSHLQLGFDLDDVPIINNSFSVQN